MTMSEYAHNDMLIQLIWAGDKGVEKGNKSKFDLLTSREEFGHTGIGPGYRRLPRVDVQTSRSDGPSLVEGRMIWIFIHKSEQKSVFVYEGKNSEHFF